jgi:Holliday junction resolvasome RuvABC endonuclease subunit
MVTRLCRLSEIPQPADVADALALAITYFMVARSEQRYPAVSPL